MTYAISLGLDAEPARFGLLTKQAKRLTRLDSLVARASSLGFRAVCKFEINI
jgi:hypothetical protein